MSDGPIVILNHTQKGLYTSIDPKTLSHVHPIWNQDMKAYSPWERSDLAWCKEKPKDCVFRSTTAKSPHAILICGKCTSSMDVAWEFIRKGGLAVWDSIIAVEQTKGRGQHQRVWMSPAGNLHAAWRWPHPADTPHLDERWLYFTSLMAGYILARILTERYGFTVKIKWPNDLMVHDKKIGGILTEFRQGRLVVGIGLNLIYSPDDSRLRNDFAVSATNFKREGYHAAPLSLWMQIVDKGSLYWRQMVGSISPQDFIHALKPYLAWVGKKVRIKITDLDIVEGVISGISNQGGLIVTTHGKERVLYSGTIISA